MIDAQEVDRLRARVAALEAIVENQRVEKPIPTLNVETPDELWFDHAIETPPGRVRLKSRGPHHRIEIIIAGHAGWIFQPAASAVRDLMERDYRRGGKG